MVRCTWCRRTAVAWSIGTADPPDCGRSRCVRATDEVWQARMDFNERLSRGGLAPPGAYDAVQRIARAAELRCGPVDWTRPVPGWVLFG